MAYQYSHAVVGGTFDHLHSGHRMILDLVFENAKKVTLGITSDTMIASKIPSGCLENFELRKKSLVDYVQKNTLESRVEIIKIEDPYGPATTSTSFDSIISTKNTHATALKINSIRSIKNLPSLKIISAPFLNDENGNIISSTNIRLGLIDRTGKVYLNLFNKTPRLNLPTHLRALLQKPLGTTIEGDENRIKMTAEKVISTIKKLNPIMVIAVGDIVSNSLISAKFYPDIIIKDYRSRRMDLDVCRPQTIVAFSNTPGTIQRRVVGQIYTSVQSILQNKKQQTVIIDGEEDLLAIPSILLAPLGSVVLYGDRNLGIILVLVDEEMKQKVVEIVKQFE